MKFYAFTWHSINIYVLPKFNSWICTCICIMYILVARVDKIYDIIHLLVHRARQAPDKLQH